MVGRRQVRRLRLPQRQVYSIRAHSLDPKCWQVTLKCGHTHNIAQTMRPKLKSMGCGPCRDGPGGTAR